MKKEMPILSKLLTETTFEEGYESFAERYFNQLSDKYGIIADTVEKEEPQLLHAMTGAALSRELFGIGDEVYGAIRWHTTGRPGMNRLEKILYLADAMEPGRAYDGVEKLRKAAFEDLDKAMRLGLAMSLHAVRSRGEIPHAMTQRALEWFCEQKEGIQ